MAFRLMRSSGGKWCVESNEKCKKGLEIYLIELLFLDMNDEQDQKTI